MPRPTIEIPHWATQDLEDPVTGVPNKEAPTPEFIQSGLNRNEPLLRDVTNYQLYAIGTWIQYIVDRMDNAGIQELP
jgi:hypothetical protein